MKRKILLVMGTRPEAIKLGPLAMKLPRENVVLCSTGQHVGILAPIMDFFGMRADYDLGATSTDRDLTSLTAAIMGGVRDVIDKERPDWVVVQGDTASALAAALAGYYGGTPVAHVEAGLRTFDIGAPWPEEGNRRGISAVAELHLAPTRRAFKNLVQENVYGKVVMTGNTVVDAVQRAISMLRAGRIRSTLELPDDKTIVMMTAHRRENLGVLDQICDGVREGVKGRDGVLVVFPVHPNPEVRRVVGRRLGNLPNVSLVEPLDYFSCVDLLDRCHFVVTDSGGLQEEAPSLGKPVVVTRAVTERPEAVEAGSATLVGHSPTMIAGAIAGLLDDPQFYHSMSSPANPFGDGNAASRIAQELGF